MIKKTRNPKIELTLKHKVILNIYAILSLFFSIITLLYSTIYERISGNIYIPIGIILLFCIVFIFVLRSFIREVISIDPVIIDKDDTNLVEIKRIEKIALEFIAIISNFIIIVLLFFYGYEKSEGTFVKILSILFIIFLFVPILFLIQSIIFETFFDRNQIYSKLINIKTLIIIFLIIIFLFLNSDFVSEMKTSIDKVYTKSIAVDKGLNLDISSDILITSISGEVMGLSGEPVSQIYVNIKGTGMDINLNSISLKYVNENTTSTLKYGTEADESHYSYEGQKLVKGDTMLKMGDKGIMTINLTSTNQELYPYKKSTIQIIPGNNKIISKNFVAPEFKGDSMILLYTN